jgi:phage shock protein C
MQGRLYRSRTNRALGGVCSGLGQYVGVDATIVRLFFVLLALANGTGILVYILMWLIVPYEPMPGVAPDPSETGAAELAAKASELGADLGSAARAQNTHTASVVGAALVVMGVLFMLQNLNLGWLWWLNFNMLWPLLLVVGGAVLIWRQLKGA